MKKIKIDDENVSVVDNSKLAHQRLKKDEHV